MRRGRGRKRAKGEVAPPVPRYATIYVIFHSTLRVLVPLICFLLHNIKSHPATEGGNYVKERAAHGFKSMVKYEPTLWV